MNGILGNIDNGLKAIRAVEGSWSLPKLPDMVALDIAAFSGLDTVGVQDLLTGLDGDVQSAMEPPDPQPTTRTYSFGDQARRVASGVANFPLPTDVAPDAVMQFKARAIRHGYLDPNTSLDSSWNPALNSVYHKMRQDDFARAKQGNVPGPGSSIGQVMDTFDKWLSPTGLLQAATELGLFWDEDQIATEFENWNPLKDVGNALTQWVKGNPIEALKSAWSALGPIDDVLMPAVNIALLTSGVGQVALFARAAKGGIVGARALGAVHGARYAPLTRINPTLGRAAMETADVGSDVLRMQQGGLIGRRILPNASVLEAKGQTVGAARMAIGRGMESWRQIPGVMITKKGVQKGMQLGFASRVEDKLGINPDRSLSDVPGVESATQFMRGYGEPTKISLPASIMFEAMFTPTLILQPGVVRNPFGFVSNFSKVGQDAFYTEEFSNAVRNNILSKGDEVAELNKTPDEIQTMRADKAREWDNDVRELGATRALAARFMGSTDEKAIEELGGWMTWMAVSSAIDADAAKHLNLLGDVVDEFVDGPQRFSQNFHTARNQLVSQVRYVDPEDVPGALLTLAQSRARSNKQALELYDAYIESIMNNPVALERFGQMIDAHNVTRKRVIQGLLETHMTPGMLEIAITSHLDDMGDWSNFTKSSEAIDIAVGKGQLGKAKSLQGVNPETGRRVGRREDLVKQEAAPIGHFTDIDDPFYFDIRDVLASDEFLDLSKDGTFNLFGGTFDPGGKFTVARKSTISKKDKIAELKAIEYLEATRDTLGRITNNPIHVKKWRELLVRVENDFGVSTANFGDVPMGELKKIMTEMEMNQDLQRRVTRLRSYASKNEIDIEAVTSHVTRRLDELDSSPRWSEVHGIQTDLGRADGGSGLAAKKKALNRQIAYTASEVDPESIPEALAKTLDDAGYKLVHGVEYMSPRDLMDELVEVKDIVDVGKYTDSLGLVGRKYGNQLANAEARVKRGIRSIGRAGQRYQQDQVSKMYNAQLRNSLHKALYSMKGRDFRSVDSADMDALLNRLRKIAEEITDNNSVRLELAKGEDVITRAQANVKSTFSPGTPADLVRTNKMTKYMTRSLKRDGYSDEEILAVIDGLKGARVVGPQLRGTAVNMQDKLQATPNLTNGMRLFSKTQIVNKPQMTGVTGRVQQYLAEGAQFAARGMVGGGVGGGLLFATNALSGEDIDLNPMTMGWGDVARLTGIAFTGRAVSGTKLAYKPQAALLKKMGADTVRHGDKGWVVTSPARKLDESLKYKHYTYMADHLSMLRDFMRFSLSPIFDASRYTEGIVLSQIGHLPETIQQAGGLRFNISPTRWRKDRAKQIAGSKKPDARAIAQADDEWAVIQAEFAGIGMRRQDFDFDALEAGTAKFRQIGILGFNVQDWMASMYADLTRIHKMEPMEAYTTAKKAFTYGLNPRSAAEMNVNALFFPFSFTKKTFGHAANFLSHDWSRAAMLHDAIKTYDMLNEHYDLHDLWRDRLPLLEKFQRLNVFAYGATPGELGGANRPYINFFNQSGVDEVTINPVINAFLPQAVEIKNKAAMEDYDRTVTRLAPVFNDIEHLIEDISEQGHVFFGGTGLTRAAEAERGYADIESYNRWIDQMIRLESGERKDGTPVATIADIRKKRWSGYYDKQQAYKEDVRRRYPGYQEAVAESVGNSIIKRQDEKELIALGQSYGPSGPGDDAPREAKLGYLIHWSEQMLKNYGSYDQVPPEYVDNFRSFASLWAEDEQYLRLGWKKHLLRTWGPIETVLD